MSVKIKSIYSKSLQKSMNISVFVPGEFENINLPVLYFLHGRTGSEEIMFQLKLDAAANELIKNEIIKPFIIVCPNMDNSRGINSSKKYCEVKGKYGSVHKGLYEDYLIKEVIPYTDENFNTINNKKSRYIGGVSAGGYAALHNAFRHPSLFSKVGGHMPAIDVSYEQEDECYFENKKMWEKYDPITIAKNQNFNDIQVFLDDGDKDEGKFFIACKELFKILKNKNVNVENYIFEGHHDAKYIKQNLKKYLKFYG